MAQRKFWEESEQESLEKVQEARVKINYPEKGPFSDKVQGMLESYRSKPELYNLIQRIQAVE